MSSTSERLDRIEAENAALRAEVDRLKGKVEPPPAPAPDYRYGGTPVVERCASVTVMPEPPPPDLSDNDLRELRRIVGQTHPSLISWPDGTPEDQAVVRFANAFRAVGLLTGTDEIDVVHSVAWWVDKAQSAIGRGAGEDDFTENDFIAAALARGVHYRARSSENPFEFGLLTFAAYGTSKWTFSLKDTWRPILKAGQINGPNKPPRHPSDRLHRDKIGPGG